MDLNKEKDAEKDAVNDGEEDAEANLFSSPVSLLSSHFCLSCFDRFFHSSKPHRQKGKFELVKPGKYFHTCCVCVCWFNLSCFVFV